MEKELITFRTFDDLALAEDIASTLKQNNIPYELKTFAPKIDIANMTSAAKQYAIMAFGDDFNRINKLLGESVANDIEKIGKDYYLFAFTNEELLDVIRKADEWSDFDVMLAKKILNDRGQEISEKKMETIQQERIEELKKPEPSQKNVIIAGYIFAFLGGLIGVFIGQYLAGYRKTLPNGEVVLAHSESDRKHGKYIMTIGTVMLIVVCFLKLTHRI
jgi:hypothetical protein